MVISGLAFQRRCLLALLMALLSSLAGCGAPNDPQSAAQAFATALVREDYPSAARYLAPSMAGKPEAAELFVTAYRAMISQNRGALRDAEVLAPAGQPGDTANLQIVWQFDQQALRTDWRAGRADKQWLLLGVSGMPVVVQRDSAGVYVTPTPSTRTLRVQISAFDQLSRDARLDTRVTLVERDESAKLDKNGVAAFLNVPLGPATLLLQMPGFQDARSSVQVGGDDPIALQLGEPLPFDADTAFINSNGAYELISPSAEGLRTHWRLDSDYLSDWNPADQSMGFVSGEGVGRIDMLGRISWRWQAHGQPDWLFSAALGEVAYVDHNDVFSVAAQAGATPQRWSKTGMYRKVLGWADRDSLIVETSTERRVLHRDGSGYLMFDNAPLSGGENLLATPDGLIHLVQKGRRFLTIGATALEPSVEIPGVNGKDGAFPYGWTSDGRYFLVNSGATELAGNSGLVALDRDGAPHQLDAEFLANWMLFSAGGMGSLQDWAFAPSGSRMALGWKGERRTGIYIADPADASVRQLTAVVPDELFWPSDDTIVYTIAQGDDRGTWALGLDGQPPHKLFAYPADKVASAPDGRLLLLANNTLWQSDGAGEPQMLGEEGMIIFPAQFTWLQGFAR